MLVISRRLHEKIVFPALQTSVQIVAVKPGVVRLGIEAPEHVGVYRDELLERNDFQLRERDRPEPTDSATQELIHLLNNRLNASSIGVALLRRQLDGGLIGSMNDTLDKIESNLKNIQQRVERLDSDRSLPARPAKLRALVVEDDHNECELLAGFLRLAGMDVHTADDGSAALDYLHENGMPHFMLLDMLLPRCDGPTTVRTIRRNPAYNGLRIFGVTGAPVEQFGLDEGPGGIDHWFRKPLNPETLLRQLELDPTPTNAKG